MREKLIELFTNSHISLMFGSDSLGERRISELNASKLADYLIANGVTIATDNNVGDKWIPVSERLPQADEAEGSICEQVQVLLSNGFVTTGWCNRYYKVWWHLNHGETHFVGFNYEDTPVVAWQPLAEPPKGE